MAVRKDDGGPESLFALARSYHKEGRLREAEALYRRVLALQPAHAQSLHRLGAIAYQCGNHGAAATLIRSAIDVADGNAVLHCHLGVVLHALGRLADAESCYRRALELEPGLADAWSNLGNVLLERGKTDAAIDCHARALAFNADVGEFHYNFGNALRARGDIAQAVAEYREAIRRSPKHADAHLNLALLLLLRGEMTEGLREYEWRWRTSAPTSPARDFNHPLWAGEPLDGKVLLIHAEQGLGDTIQFCRYVPLAAQRTQVVFEVPQRLMRLMSGMKGNWRIVSVGETLPAFDAHCPLLSLPLAFRTTEDTIPTRVPYLAAEPDRIEAWRQRLPSSGFRVGIAWQGNPGASADHRRSASLVHFLGLARLPGVRLISLQKNQGVEQLAGVPSDLVHNLGPGLDPGPDAFVDTAAVMMSLDFIITTCTSIAHLAGALGRPVWIAVDSLPHWPWKLSGDSSAWYPTARLFRQRAPGEWADVFDRITSRLLEDIQEADRRHRDRVIGSSDLAQ
jgi:tetratricopeptide (TPR) repeat protein